MCIVFSFSLAFLLLLQRRSLEFAARNFSSQLIRTVAQDRGAAFQLQYTILERKRVNDESPELRLDRCQPYRID